MSIAIVAMKLAAVKVKSLNEITVEKEKPAVVEEQPKSKDEVNTAMYGYATCVVCMHNYYICLFVKFYVRILAFACTCNCV